jgi:hypothetical protein
LAYRRVRSYRGISPQQIAARNALYEFDRREMSALQVWLADNAWVLLGITEQEWHEREQWHERERLRETRQRLFRNK